MLFFLTFKSKLFPLENINILSFLGTMIQFMMNIFSTVTETVSRQSSITIRVGAGYEGNVRHNFNSLLELDSTLSQSRIEFWN